MPRPLFIHVGSSKTGTSALQEGLWQSKEHLAAQGVGLPYVGRRHHGQRLLRPLGWRPAQGFAAEIDHERVARLPKVWGRVEAERLLISNEDLAELPEDLIGLMLDAAAEADLDVHVVLTARDWSKQLPSEWQQFLKHRMTTTYPDFLADVRDRRGHDAEHFWVRQDVVDITARWGARLAPDHVHVISVPSRAEDENGVFRLFGEAVGFDALGLTPPATDVNASYGYVEAEVLRRLNLKLGQRASSYEGVYYPAIRLPLIRGVLPRSASARITLPPEHLDWVRELGTRQVAALKAAGYRLYGDVDRLVAGEDSAAELPALDEQQVTDAAFETLARALLRAHRRRVAEAEAEAGAPVDEED